MSWESCDCAITFYRHCSIVYWLPLAKNPRGICALLQQVSYIWNFYFILCFLSGVFYQRESGSVYFRWQCTSTSLTQNLSIVLSWKCCWHVIGMLMTDKNVVKFDNITIWHDVNFQRFFVRTTYQMMTWRKMEFFIFYCLFWILWDKSCPLHKKKTSKLESTFLYP